MSAFLYFDEAWGFACLYPHDFTEYVILVPNDRIVVSAVMDKLLESPLLTVWASAICLFTIMRIFMRNFQLDRRIGKSHVKRNDFVYIVFNTFGLSFGTTSPHGVHTQAEMIIVLLISIFCLLAGNLCTGFIFEQLTLTISLPAINSFQELLANRELHLVRPSIPGLRDYSIFPNNS